MTSGGGVLEVVLVDSEGIRDRKFLGCIVCCTTSAVDRPYVCVEYGDQKRISKVAEGKGKKSIWDQKFNFEIENPIVENKSFRKLVLRVMDKHKLSDDGYVGEATIHVKDVVLMGMEKGEAELGSRKYRVVREDKSYTGDISAAISFKRKNGDDKEVERKASIMNIEDSTKIPDA
ncbi:putative C2 domain-containing protein [Helianthus annuus]|nr:putative C2 domain-containing protein [Helianthus annuus]KAJ0858620.1 putative C2 domain-containing protein [Helianthus annuus]